MIRILAILAAIVVLLLVTRRRAKRSYADTVRALHPTYYSGDDPAFAMPDDGWGMFT